MALTYEEYYRRYLDDLLTGDPPQPPISNGGTPQYGEIIIGPPGPPGPTGPQGIQGIQGQPGTNGAISLIQDEGIGLTVRPTLDFIGAGVTAADDSTNNRTTITIPGGGGVSSFNTRTGAVVPISGDYTAAQVTNAVDQTGSYANPAWITSFPYSKLTGTPTLFTDPTTTKGDLIVHGASTTRLPVGTDNFALIANSGVANGINWAAITNSFNGRTGAVTPQSGDYTAAQVGAVPTTRQVIAGTGLTGGGALSADVTLTVSAGAGSPLTTKGDLYTFSTVNTRLGVGANNTVLMADSTQTTGNKWAAVVNSISPGTLTGAVTLAAGNAITVTQASQTITIAAPVFIASGVSHTSGSVPDPGASAGTLRYLREDSTWANPQTPWASNINGNSFNLTSVALLGVGNTGTAPSATTFVNAIVGSQSATTLGVVTACSNQTGTSGVAVGSFSFANYNIVGAEKRIADIRCDTDGAINSGRVNIVTYNAGTSFPALVCTAVGNTGIGVTPSSLAQLHVKHGSTLDTFPASTNWAACIYNATNSSGSNGLLVKNNWAATSSMLVDVGNDSGSVYTSFFKIDGTGQVGIGITPAFLLQLGSDSAAKPTTNTWTIPSGTAVKKNIKKLKGGLEIINKLEPVEAEYNGKANTPEGQRVVSFIAEEIREILPHTVSEDKNGNLSFNIHEVLIHMVLAIKQLSSEIEKLKQPHLPHLGDFFKRHA